MTRNHQLGFTLIELLITVVVLGILVALAAPSMSKILDSRKLKGAAEGAYATFNFAKSEAIKRNQNVRIYFTGFGAGNNWCYGLKVNASCDCTETNPADSDYCEIDGVKRSVNQDDYEDIYVANGSAPFGGNTSFNAIYGKAKAGNIEFQMSDGRKVKVSLSNLGRTVICSDDGVGGYAGCP